MTTSSSGPATDPSTPPAGAASAATGSGRAQLQVALDFLILSRALKVAEEAVAGGADILEVGTPLLKSEGLDAVRALRERWPRIPIVADTKTMDAGRTEMEMAAKAGATHATVLAAASDATIRECVEVGANYGIEVIVDLVGVADPAERARQVAALGARAVGVHCAIDEQMLGRAPFEVLNAVRRAVDIKVLVAGGINLATAGAAAAAGADVVIVGGAISKSPDARGATAELVAALASGAAASTADFMRYDEATLREAFLKASTPNISDAMHRGGVLQGLPAVVSGVKMIGRAVTVRTYPGDWAKPVEAIDIAQAGEVLVIDAGGRPPAIWGELATESCLQRGISGVVIDGAIRDIDTIRESRFPAFARHICPNAWEPKGFGEINKPVTVGGQSVRPGDWIVGDESGVVCIPAERAVEIGNRALDVAEMENRVRGEIRGGSTLSQVAEIYRWEKK